MNSCSWQVCTLDNRGAGRSGLPTKKRWTYQSALPYFYHVTALCLTFSTTEMAHDVLNLIDHIQWTDVHVVGISMGGMVSIACRWTLAEGGAYESLPDCTGAFVSARQEAKVTLTARDARWRSQRTCTRKTTAAATQSTLTDVWQVEGLRLMMTSYRQNTPEKKAPFSMQLLYSKVVLLGECSLCCCSR